MASTLNMVSGIVHGNTIELRSDLGLPEGQEVAVLVQPLLPSAEALRQSFGGWAEDAAELDQFLENVRTGRRQERAEPHQ